MYKVYIDFYQSFHVFIMIMLMMMMFPNDTEYIDLLDPARAAKLPTNHISAALYWKCIVSTTSSETTSKPKHMLYLVQPRSLLQRV